MTDPSEALKRQAALAALEHVEEGMRLGLGTGSTAALFVEALGARVGAGLGVVCVPTSEATRARAEALRIPLATLDEHPNLDLTVDGADEINPALDLIKGGGGALLREKIVAFASRRMIVIADHSKRVERLGAHPLPVEVVRFGARASALRIEDAAKTLGLSGEVTLRQRGGRPFVSDGGNVIFDCAFGAIPDPRALGQALEAIPGVVEHGLFVGMADLALVAGPEGVVALEAGRDSAG